MMSRAGKIARSAATAGFVLALAGCGGGGQGYKTENLNVAPTNYKAQIVLLLSRTLDDPTNVRDAFVSEPVLGNNGKGPYFVCLRFNPRDANKRYEGSQDRIGYFYEGQLNQLVAATPEQCGKAAYQPFPELQKVCFANKCE